MAVNRMQTGNITMPQGSLGVIDIPTWLDIQKAIKEITGFSLYLYDSKGRPLVEPEDGDRFHNLLLKTKKGREALKGFYKEALTKAALSDEPYITRSPINQYLFILPLKLKGDEKLFIVGGYCYLNYEDFSNFVESSYNFDLSPNQITPLARDITFKDYTTLEAVARFLKTILKNFIKVEGESVRSRGREEIVTDQRQRAILGLIAELLTSSSYEEMGRQVFQSLCILFDIESMGLLLREGGYFVTRYAFGNISDSIKDIRIKMDEPIIHNAVDRQRHLTIEGLFHLLEAGFNEAVKRVDIFPFVRGTQTQGLILIYNTTLQEDEIDTIYHFIRLLSFTWEYLQMQDECMRIKRSLSILTDIHKVLGSIVEADRLYDMILEKSTELIKAEQGSIMVLEPSTKELIVKAVKGINKNLADYLKIKVGEGIAGKVFEESIPMIVKDVEDDPRIEKRNRPRYKTKSFISIPLKIDNRTIGVLNITDKITGEVFSEDDLRLLQSFANYASIAIERAKLFQMSEDLRKISITDSLTGLLNRRYFQKRLNEELERSKRHNHPLSLIMIDIDDFKPFNDSRGHVAGDSALKAVAKAIRDTVRTIDVVSRYGGEEFSVILPQTDKESSSIIAERIRSEVERISLPDLQIPTGSLTISLGLASYPVDAIDLTGLINSADRALYRAKAMGKNRVCVCGE